MQTEISGDGLCATASAAIRPAMRAFGFFRTMDGPDNRRIVHVGDVLE